MPGLTVKGTGDMQEVRVQWESPSLHSLEPQDRCSPGLGLCNHHLSGFTCIFLRFLPAGLSAFRDTTKCIRSNVNISLPKLDERAHSTFRKDPKHLNSEQKDLISAVMNYKEGINAFILPCLAKTRPSLFVSGLCVLHGCCPRVSTCYWNRAGAFQRTPDTDSVSRRFRPGGQG